MDANTLDELRRAAAVLKAHDVQRGALLIERDRLIAEALAQGSSWNEVRGAAGLALHSLEKAIERHRGRSS